MKRTLWLVSIVTVVTVALALCAPVAGAQGPASVPPIPPASDKLSQAYLDALTYWYKLYFPVDWQTKMALALTPEPDYDQRATDDENKPPKAPEFVVRAPTAERVTLTGLPANSWWIDCWRLELSGTWTTVSAWRPAMAAPGPVEGDLAIQGKLPGIYVLRVCDKTGAVLLGEPKVILVSWTGGSGNRWPQIFDVPGLPKATADMLQNIKM
jgi:hypothetical protein